MRFAFNFFQENSITKIWTWLTPINDQKTVLVIKIIIGPSLTQVYFHQLDNNVEFIATLKTKVVEFHCITHISHHSQIELQAKMKVINLSFTLSITFKICPKYLRVRHVRKWYNHGLRAQGKIPTEALK